MGKGIGLGKGAFSSKNFHLEIYAYLFWHVYGVLNVVKQQNWLHSLDVQGEMNFFSLISAWLVISATVPTCANDAVKGLKRFVSWFPSEFWN